MASLQSFALPTHVGVSHCPEEYDGLTSFRRMRSAARPIPSTPAGPASRSVPCSPEPSPSSWRRLSPVICIGDGNRNSKKNSTFGPDGNGQKRPSCRRPKRQVRTGTAGNATASVSKQQDQGGLRPKGQCKPFVAPYVPSTAEGIIAMDMLRRRDSEPHGMVVEEEFFHRRVGEQLLELQEQIDLWQKRLEVLEVAGENCGAYEEGWEGLMDHPDGPWDSIMEQGYGDLNMDWGDEDAVMGSRSTGWDAVLSRKVAALQVEHLEKATEEVLYAMVMQRFCRLDVKLLPPMTRRAKGQRVSRVNMGPSRAQQLRGVLSPGCHALLEQQLAMAVGDEAMALFDDAAARGDGANGSSEGHKILFRKRELAELYVSSILCGLCLRRVERRLALESALASDDDDGWEEDSDDEVQEGEGEDGARLFYGRLDGGGGLRPQPDSTRLYLERLLAMGSAPAWLPQSQAGDRPTRGQAWDDGTHADGLGADDSATGALTSGITDAGINSVVGASGMPLSSGSGSPVSPSGAGPLATVHRERLEQGNAMGRADAGGEQGAGQRDLTMGGAAAAAAAAACVGAGAAGWLAGGGAAAGNVGASASADRGDYRSKLAGDGPAGTSLGGEEASRDECQGGGGGEEGYRDHVLPRGHSGDGSGSSMSVSGAAWRGGLGRGVAGLSSASIREYMCMLPRELLQDLTHISSTASVNVVGRHVQAVFGLSFVSSGGGSSGGSSGSRPSGGPAAARDDACGDSEDEERTSARRARGGERRGAPPGPAASGSSSSKGGSSASTALGDASSMQGGSSTRGARKEASSAGSSGRKGSSVSAGSIGSGGAGDAASDQVGPNGGRSGAYGGGVTEDSSGGSGPSDATDRELEAVVKLPIATLRRVHMEAAAFGVFLCDMEHEVNCLALARTLREH